MANYFEKVAVYIDVKAEKAQSALKGFAKSIKDAQGASAKFKALGTGIQDVFKKATATPTALLGTLTAVGGAAVTAGTFLVGLATKFMRTALQANNFATAVGLSVEESSRWIAIADDVGLSAEDLQTAFQKVTKSLDTAPFEKYGIKTRNLTGNLKPMNEILLDTLGTIGTLHDPTLRAAVGNDLLGKSYNSLAPLIGKTRQELEKMLGTVSDAQVITSDQVAAAKDLQKSNDDLGDTGKDLGNIWGSSLIPIVNKGAQVLRAASVGIMHPTQGFKAALQVFGLATDEASAEVKHYNDVIDGMAYANELTARGIAEVARQHEKNTKSTENDTAAVKHLHDETERLIKLHLNQIDTAHSYERAQMDAVDAVDAYYKAQQDAIAIGKDGSKTEVEKKRAVEDVRRAQLDAADAILHAAQEESKQAGYIDGTSDSIRTQIQHLEAAKEKYPKLRDEIQLYIDKLKEIPGFIDVNPKGFKAPVPGYGPGSNAIVPPPINITVNGALDPNAVARQIDRMLRDLYSRGGGTGVSIYGGRR